MSIENKVREIVIENVGDELENENFGVEDDFSELGINSVSFLKVVVAIETEFDFEFEDDDLNISNFKNLKSLANYVNTKISD